MSPRPLVLLALVEAVLIAMLSWSLLRPDKAVAPEATHTRPGAAEPDTPTPSINEPTTSVPDPVPDPIAPTDRSSDAPPTLALDGTLLCGRIKTSDGPLPRQGSVTIRRTDIESVQDLPQPDFSAERPAFAIPGLTSGSYELTVKAPGFRNATTSLDIAPGVERVRQDFELHRTWELLVEIVTPEGRPLWELLDEQAALTRRLGRVEVAALATTAPPPSPIPGVTGHGPEIGIGRWNGIVSLVLGRRARPPKRFAGILELPIDEPLYVSAILRSAVLATERVAPGQKEVRLVVPFESVLRSLSKVHLQLVDPSGAPLAGVRVGLDTSQSSSHGEPTDSEGRVTLTRQSGVLRLAIFGPNLVIPRWNLELAPGADLDLGRLAMVTPYQLRVQIEGAPPESKVGCSVKSLDPPPDPHLAAVWIGAPTGVPPATSLPLAPGRYALRATAGSTIATTEFDTRSLGDAPLVVTLQPGAVLHVIPPPVERQVRLALLDGSGSEVWKHQITGIAAFDITLLPGPYTAVITGADGSSERRNLALAAGSTGLDLR